MVTKYKILRALAYVLFVSSVAGCSFIVVSLTSEHASLEYLGTIEFQEPTKKGNVTSVPVDFKNGKWLQNSGTCLNEIEAKVKEYEIYISAKLCVCGVKTPFYGFNVKNIKPGRYEVIYKNPNRTLIPIGTIEL